MRKIASPQITARVIFQPELPVFSTKWWVPVTLTQYPTFILVPRARRFLVTWSGNVGYKLSRLALGTRMPYLLIDKSPEMKTLHYRLAFQENITPSLSFCRFFISEKPGSISCFN